MLDPASTPRSPIELADVDGVAEVATKVNGYAQIVDKNGKLVGDAANVPILGANWVSVDELNPYRLDADSAARHNDSKQNVN